MHVMVSGVGLAGLVFEFYATSPQTFLQAMYEAASETATMVTM